MPHTVTAFRFNAADHVYTDLVTGAVLPHITGMLERTGWVDDTFYTEESCERGLIVHAMTSDYDLGALDPDTCIGKHRGYLLGHVACMRRLRPTWDAIEVPLVHPHWKFGGRPDRVGVVLRERCVFEIKTAVPSRAHAIQTALQAVLVASQHELPAAQFVRYCEYLTPKGKYKLERHIDRGDFDEAYRILQVCTR